MNKKSYFLLLLIILLGYAMTGIAKSLDNDPKKICITKTEYQDFQRYLEVRDVDAEIVQRIKLYDIAPNQTLLNITDRVIQSDYYQQHPKLKETVVASNRQFYIFKYPSDDLTVLGYISYIPAAESAKTIFTVRGGNNSFGLPHPGRDFLVKGDYTYIGSTIRGGINPGRDEFGGNDTHDVVNLVKYIPTLNSELNLEINADDIVMIGVSRGAMQGLLALSRSEWLQNKVSKFVSAVGLLDVNQVIEHREDMRNMFYTDFGLNDRNRDKWVAQRNPPQHVNLISKDIPILIMQGGKDIRISNQSGKAMYQLLKQLGFAVTYWEDPNNDHHYKGIDQKLASWLFDS